MNPTDAAPGLDLSQIAIQLAETPDSELPHHSRRRLRILASTLTVLGSAWLIGGIVAHDVAVLMASYLCFFFGGVAAGRASRIATLRRISRVLPAVGTIASFLFAGFAMLMAFLSTAAAIAAGFSSLGLTTAGFWFSNHPLRDLGTAALFATTAVATLLLVTSAATPQLSALKPRMRRVPVLQTCWVIAELVVVGAASSFLIRLFVAAAPSAQQADFDFVSAIVGVAALLIGAIFAWHYRNRQFVVNERNQLLTQLSTTVHFIRQGVSPAVPLSELQRLVRPAVVARRSVATPPLTAFEITTLIDALYAASSGLPIPLAFTKRAGLPDPEGSAFRRAIDVFTAEPEAFLHASLPLLEDLRTQLLTGHSTHKPHAEPLDPASRLGP